MTPEQEIVMTTNRSNAARTLTVVEPETAAAVGRAGPAGIDEDREALMRAIGHQLRSPLTAMSLGIDLVQRDPASKARILGVMKATVQRMDLLIDELFRFASGYGGEAPPTRDAISFHVELLKRRLGTAAQDGGRGERR